VLLGVHALIHLMGFAKAFGYAELPQLVTPISRPWGLVWLLAAALVATTAAMVAAQARMTWAAGLVALLVSQAVILSAWRDAWAGTIANVVLLVVVAHGWLTEGPWSDRAQFLRDATAPVSMALDAPPVTDADVAALPDPVQRYLRATGVVGQPRVLNYRLHFRGRIRADAGSRWMPFRAEQRSFVDGPARFFLMRARMYGVPVEAFHRFADGHASMRVKLAGVATLTDASGEEMDRSETVTLLNDMCLLAPGTLPHARIAWETVDARTARAAFTHAGHTVHATLYFDDDGLLTNFLSDDRSRALPDGQGFVRARFSTPVLAYRSFGSLRLAADAEARWQTPDGEFVYGEFALLEAEFNVR